MVPATWPRSRRRLVSRSPLTVFGVVGLRLESELLEALLFRKPLV
jgi:hypothetical protein